ncbi:hypothetical protein NDR87_11195 [Nocardia sp. CDC159]|uniref:Clp R domain-containing protein n=1 Tax=Nocardia pulmonis TaxID=2951408 RepID=A0A9X2IW89_9NOCA|nr:MULTISPECIES: Clp protease N-terminal domain-containing protein [Nocardia]MCM6774038.1 hypothetical protein [Nocardia pulmonis]MCM6786925.1 hypothetical protein [Nocardia sp. CDC159]
MFERFTDQARRIVILAQEEARARGHDYIGTEHLLLGVLYDENSVAVRALRSCGIEPERIRADVAEQVGSVDSDDASAGHIPFTAHAKSVLELSLREAMALGHSHIGTEHILLALIREPEGAATRVLTRCGAELATMRTRIRSMATEQTPPSKPTDAFDSPAAARAVIGSLEAENALLRREVDRLRQFITRKLGEQPPAAG